MRVMGTVCVLLLAPLLRGDGIADLRAVLAKMGAREPVRASISLETHSKSDDGDDKPDVGKTTFEAEHGTTGLRLTYAPEVITRAQQEARANNADPEKPTPTRTAMRQIDPEELIEALDAAGAIARELDRATLLKDQRITIGGRPGRQLTLSLNPKLSKSDAKRVKSFSMTMTLNLDADNVPVSAELKQSLKAKVLLVSFQQDQHITWSFGRTGDRLVATRRHEKSSGSGLGQKFESSKLMTLAVR